MVAMRELQRCSRNNQPSPIRRLPPIVRSIIRLPLALLLFAYVRTVDVVQWRTALSLAIQSITDSKQVTIAEVKASGPTYSRSWYIESTAATAMGDMQALAERDVRWTMKSQQCDGKHSASFVLLDFGEPHTLNGIYGTYTVKTNVFWSDSDIAAAAQHYL